MSAAEIERRIPHRAPMLLIDEIVSSDHHSVVCRKTFRDDEYFVQGHFPGRPIVPGVIQCECCLQAGALLITGQLDGAVPVVTRMDGVKFKQVVCPGDTVEIHATLKEQVSNAYFMTGKLILRGKTATRLDFACSTAASPGGPDA